MKRFLKRIRNNFLKAGAIVLAVVCIAASVFHATSDVNASDAGPGDYDTRACKTGICWNLRKRGAFWVKIPVSSNGVSVSSLGFDYVFRNVSVNCYTGDPSTSYVYVLSTRLSNGGIAGMVNMDDVTSRGNGVHDGDGGRAPGTIVSENTAYSRFQENAQEYLNQFGQKYTGHSQSGTGLAYFCHSPSPESSKKKSSPPDDIPQLKCGAFLSSNERAKGDTRTRIAVQNMSLDGTYAPTDSAGNAVRWHANGSRSGITSDSMWTRNGASVYTLAKPGDSIRFYHAVCMAVRYGRWTPDQGSWVSQETHSLDYDPLPNNWMKIHADPSVYVFEYKSTWNSFASQVASVSAHENLFSSAGAGSHVDATRSAIDIINPTQGVTAYTCNEISWYAARDPFIAGGYHIPGFKSGNCSSAAKTGIKQATGTTISQWHEFNALRMWEIRSHTWRNSCGCGQHGATLVGNYTAAHYDNAWQGGTLGNRYEYYCKDEGKTTLDCAWSCDVQGEYGCISGSYKKTQYHYSDRSFDFMYNTTHEGQNENNSKWATVYVPYNYTTTVDSDIDAGDVTFQGAAISTRYDWSVNPRQNDKTGPDQSSYGGYATSTPDTGRPNETHVIMFEWLYYPGNYNTVGEEFSSRGPKQYYSSGMVPGSYHIVEDRVGDQNPQGKYIGQSNGATHTRTIPDNDEYIGYKYCTAVAFYPSDSHNNLGNSLSIQKSTGYNGAMDAGERWNISGASCRTIAKKPNFQVWNGSIYTEGKISTSITRKWTNAEMKDKEAGEYKGSNTDVFGSWADYAIVAYGQNKTMASGATLGYSDAAYDLRGKGGKKRSDTSPQKLNPETIANNNNPTGKSGVYTDASYNQNLARLESRYKDKAKTLLSEIGHNSTEKRIYSTKTGMQVANVGGGETKISDLGITGGGYPNSGTLTNNSNGLVKRLGDGKNDNTLVIVSSGTIVIDRNICYGTNCNGDATKLRTYSNGTSTREAATLPQILIFANNIKVKETVTRIDAWLISPNGTLNTCMDHKIGGTAGSGTDLVARDASDRHYTNGNCGLTLVINGPVFAKHIDLLRTAGAFHGYADTSAKNVLDRSVGATGGSDDKKKGSVAPAEIFNLRADVYIWAFNQAQRYSEAVVTYTRELAPRY